MLTSCLSVFVEPHINKHHSNKAISVRRNFIQIILTTQKLQLGFKTVLICSLLASLVTSGALPFIPPYRSLEPQVNVVVELGVVVVVVVAVVLELIRALLLALPTLTATRKM